MNMMNEQIIKQWRLSMNCENIVFTVYLTSLHVVVKTCMLLWTTDEDILIQRYSNIFVKEVELYKSHTGSSTQEGF